MKPIAGAILAGGKSSRMGKDKSSLLLNGRTLLQHMRDTLEGCGLTDILVSRHDRITDIIPGGGPLSGLHALLLEARGNYESLLVVAVDMPRLEPMHLTSLMEVKSDKPFVRYEDIPLPCVMRVDGALVKKIEQRLQQAENLSCRRFQDLAGTVEIPLLPDTRRALTSVNTPEEFGELAEVKA